MWLMVRQATFPQEYSAMAAVLAAENPGYAETVSITLESSITGSIPVTIEMNIR